MLEIPGFEIIEQNNSDQIIQPWDLLTYSIDCKKDTLIINKWVSYFKDKGHPYAIIKQNTTQIIIVDYTADDLIEGTPYEIPLFLQRIPEYMENIKGE